jgi:TRAP-type C4-dicarboxylate transport system permease small subunit
MNIQKLPSTIKLILDKLCLWTAALGSAAIFTMMLVMTSDALGRKIIGTFPGAYETAIGLLAILMFSSQGYAQMRRVHLVVDFLTSRLNQKTQTVLNIIWAVLGVGIFGLLTWLGWKAAWKYTLVREIWFGIVDYPAWPFRWFVPLGAGLAAAQFLRTAIDEFGKALRKE